jgi:hypothetical protein
MPSKRPEPLADTLRRFLDKRGLAKRVGQAASAWKIRVPRLDLSGFGVRHGKTCSKAATGNGYRNRTNHRDSGTGYDRRPSFIRRM